MLFRVHRVYLGILLLAGGWLLTPLVATAAETSFVPLPPCRIVDTRQPGAGGAFAAGETRTFDVVGATLNYSSQGGSTSGCGIPGFYSGAPEVQAVAVNVVAVNPTVATAGYLKGWAGGGAEPTASFLNYNKMTPPLNSATGTVLPVRQDSAGDDLNIKASQPVQVVIDVVGYYRQVKDEPVQVGTKPTGSSFPYNAFSTPFPISPTSGDMTSTDDLYTERDIEVGGELYLSKNLYMEGNNGPGADGDQTIYFYDAGNRETHYIRWDESEDKFVVAGSLHVFNGYLEASGFRSSSGYEFYSNWDNLNGSWFRVFQGQYAAYEQMRIENGDEAPAKFDGAVQANGLDYAEAYKITDGTLEGGDVVSLQLARKEYIQRSAVPYDDHLVGVISAKPGFVTGDSFNAEEQADPAIAQRRAEARQANDAEAEKQYTLQLQAALQQQQRAVALAGRVPVKVDAGYGPIRAGDYLTASATPGHAMAMTRAGKTLGIALEGFAGAGRGTVLALIQPGWYGGAGAATANAATATTTATDGAVATASGDQVQIRLDSAAGQTSLAVVAGDPSGPGQAVFEVDTDGNVRTKGTVQTAAAGLAGYYPVLEPVAPGDVLVASRAEPGWLQRGAAEADPAVVGIVVEQPGVVTAADVRRIAVVDPTLAAAYAAAQAAGDADAMARLWGQIQILFGQKFAAIALADTVPCRVDARYGAIAVGDLLVTAPTPGHAMRTDEPLPGTVLGKALAPVAAGTATIPVLVMLR